MPPSHEQRAVQKRTYTMLLEALQDPKVLHRLVKHYKIEMEQEDAAYVERALGITDKELS